MKQRQISKLHFDIVGLERLAQEPYSSVVCYPRPREGEVRRRIAELNRLGIAGLIFVGSKEVSKLRVVGKGCVGVMVSALRNEEHVALKIRRVDADRSSMKHEAQMLKKANAAGVGPKMIAMSRNFLVEQFIDGLLFPDWLRKRKSRTVSHSVLSDLLEQCWRLDEIGLDHGELSYAPKHLIVDGLDRPWIVDFESASVNRRVSNITSLSQFLFMNRTVAAAVSRRIGKADKTDLVDALKKYKRQKTRDNLERLLMVCRLR